MFFKERTVDEVLRNQRFLCNDVGKAERAQAKGNDYATVEISRSEYMSLAEAAIFKYAFKLGMRIAIETLIK